MSALWVSFAVPTGFRQPPALCRCIRRNQSLTEHRVLAFSGSKTDLQQVAHLITCPGPLVRVGGAWGPRAGSLRVRSRRAGLAWSLSRCFGSGAVLCPLAPQPQFLSHVWLGSPVSLRRSRALGTLRSWNSPSIPFQSRLRLRPAAPTDLHLCLRWTLLTPAHPSASPGSWASALSRSGPSGGSHHLDLTSDMSPRCGPSL